jgi:hypothetical protein
MRASRGPDGGKLAYGMYEPQVLAAIRVDNDTGVQSRWLRLIPEKELFPISLERDLDQMSGRRFSFQSVSHLLGELAHAQELLPTAAEQLVGLEVAQLVNVTQQCFLE